MAQALLLVEENPCHLVSHAELQCLTISKVSQEQKKPLVPSFSAVFFNSTLDELTLFNPHCGNFFLFLS